ncbi:DUF4349 domain-containing protein [Bacteroidota bacterium]
MNKITIVIVLIALFASCSGNYEKDSFSGELAEYELADKSMMSPATQALSVDQQLESIEPDYQVNKKIIKDANISLEVENYAKYRIELDSLINSVKGYISIDNLDKNDYSINCNMTIRIPSQNFEKFISVLENGSEKLLYKNISARDVTEEFIDIEARLKTKKEVEKRYIQLLSRAKNIKEILEIEDKLGDIREEIESKEGRLKYLRKRVSFSTIYLQVTQILDYKYEPAREKGFFQKLFKSLDKGWKGFLVFLLFLFRLWPLFVIGFLVLYYIRYVRKKKKIKKASEVKEN